MNKHSRQTILGRLGTAASAALIAVAALLVAPVGPAHAQDMADSFAVQGTVDREGVLRLSTTLTFRDSAPATLTQRIETKRDTMDFTSYRFDVSDVTAKAGDLDLAPQVSTDGDYKVITIDGAKAGSTPITIGYTVRGAAHQGAEVAGRERITTVDWRVLQGLSVGVRSASGTIVVPTRITSVDCRSGAPADPQPCSLWAGGTHDAPNPYFEDGARGPGEVIWLSFGASSSAIAANEQLELKWTLDRAFSTDPLPLGAGLGALLLGGLGLYGLHRTKGKDQLEKAEPTLAADFVPTGAGESEFVTYDAVRPGQVGTLLDERVDPVDVAATVLDLAVGGHLVITELDTPPRAPLDWTFQRTDADHSGLRPYERTLLDAIAPVDGTTVTVSQISKPIMDVIPDVQDELYGDAVAKGWFVARPDDTRDRWGLAGWVALGVALVALGLLVAFSHFGLLGLSLVALALGLVYIAQRMPRRTAAGASLYQGLQVLAMSLRTQPVAEISKDKAYQQISKVLPFAVVLGGSERWLDAMVAADDDHATPDPTDLSWYRAPGDWHLADLPRSLKALVTTIEGELYGRR